MNNVKAVLRILLFFLFVGLVIYGQKTVGKVYLGMELLGLAGLIALLWDYNRKYT